MRIVLDTNVVVSGLLWEGPPRQLLKMARIQRLQLFTSPVLLMELSEIFQRPKFDRKLAAAEFTVDQIVERYAWLATVVYPEVIAPVVINDPDDDHVLACALAANANLIVSGDQHLLGLSRYESMDIVTVSAALDRVTELGAG